ncbi:MAG: 2'-5' RNA ligase [Oleiphilaceae bacterium]|jgi:2'-5' RNA ligase
MLDDFLSNTHTDALCDKNFEEWHLGIPYYGFWAIVIEQPEYLSLISKAQNHLQHFFLPNYSRQAHITLNVCGLMSEDHFSNAALDDQISIIEEMKLSVFEVSLSHIDSFTTAAYLHISDASDTLCKINQTLSVISHNSTPTIYQPHITLGLYREKFESKCVVEEIMKFGRVEIPSMIAKEVHFCRYETSNIQGPIEVLKRIKL